METLRNQIEQAPDEQTPVLRKERKVLATELTASDWLEKGYNATSLEKMVDCFTKAIELNPSFDEAFLSRGNTYIEMSEKKLAINDLSQAIQINPSNARAYNNRGVIYYEKGIDKHAISDFSQAIEINPNFTNAWYNLGLIYEYKGERANARRAYKKAVELGHPKAQERLDNLR